VFLSRNFDQNCQKCVFVFESVKVAAALGLQPPLPPAVRATPRVVSFYTVTTFYRHRVLAIKHFIVIEKEQFASFFTSNSVVIVDGGRKNIIAPAKGTH